MKRGDLVILLFFLVAITSAQSNTDSLIDAFNNGASDSLRVEAALKLSDLMISSHPDSLYDILQAAFILASNEGYSLQSVDIKIKISQVFDRLDDYVNVQKTSLEADKMLENMKSRLPDSTYVKDKISILNSLAIVYYRTGKMDEAREHYHEIIALLETTPPEKLPSRSLDLFVIAYNNLGSTYLQLGDYDNAEVYLLKAMSYMKEDDSKGLASILNNLGIIEKDRHNYEKAYDYLTRAIQIRRENNRTDGVIQSLNNLGDLLWMMGSKQQALDTLKKCARLARENKLLSSYSIALETLAGIYSEMGDYRNAYNTYVEYKQVNDSLMDQENLRNITQLELQQRFEQRLNEENLIRQKEDLKRQRTETIYLFITITAILLLAMLIMLYALQRSKMKRQALIAEKDRLVRKSLELENEKLNLDLDYKNKELTTNVLYLSRTNEFIAEVADKLLKRRVYFSKENQKLIDELIRDLQSFSDRDTWKEFELRFQEVHTDFYNKLLELYPDLSVNEKKLCAFLRLNMTTKEIAAITYQSINSLTVARSRLRKKLGIDKDENLIAFLEKL